MKKPWIWMSVTISVALSACSSSTPPAPVDVKNYQVADTAQLQQRFAQLNQKLVRDFKQLKQTESVAFSDQSDLDAHDLRTLNLHLVSQNALKPSKIAYCKVMNQHFSEMYRLGHYNLKLVSGIELPNAKNENLVQVFQEPDQFYQFIIQRYTTYRQVQEGMGYGCNLAAALK